MEIFSSFDQFVPEKYKAILLGVFAKYWSEISQSAVAQYAEQGRSVMIIDMCGQEIRMTGLALEEAVAFFDKFVLEGENQGDDSLPLMHNVVKLVQTYDPTKEMVLLFSFPDNNEIYCQMDLKKPGSTLPDLN